MFKKVCVILTSLCLLTACNVNEDLVKDQEAKTKDEKTSEVSKNTTSKASEEKKEKESFKSSDESSTKKETSKQNEDPAQKKEASSASNKETSNKTAVTKSESAPAKEETPNHPAILLFLLRQKMKLLKHSRNQRHLHQALRRLPVREALIQVFHVTSFRMAMFTSLHFKAKAKPLHKASIIWIRSCILAIKRSPITPFSLFIETIRPLRTMG